MNKICLSLLAVLVLSGCNGNENDNGNLGFQQAELQPVQGYCAPYVVDAYNNFATKCNNMYSNFSVQQCRMAAQGYLQAHSGLSCIVELGFSDGCDPRFNGQYQGRAILKITDYPMREVIRWFGPLDGSGSMQPNWHEYRRWPQGRPWAR